eukprot:SAG22_NODE_460_length_10218_cov_5.663109_8_plen_55_part_00
MIACVVVDNCCSSWLLLLVAWCGAVQTAVNNVIVKAQAYTANPKTDSRLGKVGR